VLGAWLALPENLREASGSLLEVEKLGLSDLGHIANKGCNETVYLRSQVLHSSLSAKLRFCSMTFVNFMWLVGTQRAGDPGSP
jgi:hypothetical protein